MNGILTILKKEFARFFGDRKILITTVFLPGIMIFLLYNVMGSAISSQLETDTGYRPVVYTENLPESLQEMFSGAGLDVKEQIDETAGKTAVEERTADLYLRFPENFLSQVDAYTTSSGEAAPNVTAYYNSASTDSQTAYTMFMSIMDAFESSMANKFDINRDVSPDLATSRDTAAMLFSMMLPMLMMIFIFSGCMAVAPESIAGEKERGTIATLLVTPVRRSSLAIGKIIALSCIALLSGISSFTGTILSIPKLIGSAAGDVDASAYGIGDYLQILAVILVSVLIIVGLISIISCFAKSVKEASTAVLPLMIVVMLVGISSMLGGGAPSEPYFYLIPLYNSVQCMTAVFSFEITPVNFLLTVVSNLVYAGGLCFLLTRLFNSERVMFSK